MSEPHERRQLPSSAQRRLGQHRRELVLQLYLRRGPLWEAVRDCRERLSIVAKVQLPPSVLGRLLPEDAPTFDDRAEYTKYAVWWGEEMSAIGDKLAPTQELSTRGPSDHNLEASWEDFLSACVLYDPPEDRLLEFASYGGPEPTVFSGGRLPTKANLEGLPEMVDPPIKSLADLMGAKDWYWHRVLDHIGAKYLEPWGVDVHALLEAVMWEVPGLYEKHLETYRRYSRRYYIEVDEHTTRGDVEKAFHMIRSIEPPKQSKPPRDRLTAVQCAILYDCHNEKDPDDGRRWKWTFKALADRFGLQGARAAKDHVELGREILSGKDFEER